MQNQPPFESDTDLQGGAVSQAKSKAAQLGRKAATVIDDKRDALARGMASAASSLHYKAESLSSGSVASMAHRAADTLESAAGYVRYQDLEGMLSDMRQIVKRHPGATLLTAVALGFLLARSLTRH